MLLKECVQVTRRFLRSVRIDTDFADVTALEGFVCPQSSADVLLTMAKHVAETRQGAFTWTGPYGGGKSSLAIALSALLSGKAEFQRKATEVFGRKLTASIWDAMPTGTRGWRVLPVVGCRENPVRVIGEAMQAAGLVPRQPRGGWSESKLIEAVTETAAALPRSYGGLIIFIDEMGKFLESVAQDDTDIYVFQRLAEAASRSNGRLLIVGILHQAFEEYANRLSREARDEWSKIQGRFIDLPVNSSGDEQIDLLSHAIFSNHRAKEPSQYSLLVASLIHRDRSADAGRLALTLENCWPLHPVVACLLGPISRRRFGQNQRSIFGFLNSAEPYGFQDFLRRTDDQTLYRPDHLWNYLRANLEPSILASPDGHRWALAAEALERCESVGGDALHVRLLKSIAIIDLFKERSGLAPSFALLGTCFPEISEFTLQQALNELNRWSLTIFKKHLGAYAIYAGSDFDIDEAVRSELTDIDALDFTALKALAGLPPILAKRHYHETGSMRWFEVNLTPLRDIATVAATYEPINGSIGQFLLAIPTANEDEDEAAALCREAARRSDKWEIVAGFSKRSWAIVTFARELIALEAVRLNRPELTGDAVARREVAARLAALQSQLESELHKAFDDAQWFRKHHSPRIFKHAELNSLASELADRRFDQCPRLHNELLNRQRPSSNAIAAQNALLRRMVLNEGEARLGIEGFPAEGGLFVSILEATGLYTNTEKGWHFVPPSNEHSFRLAPMWNAAAKFIKAHGHRTIAVSELYALWRGRPFGIKDGLLPILVVAFILSHRNTLAVYRDAIFRARFDDVDVDYLSKDPAVVQVRWMDLSDVSRRLLSGMAEIVRTLDDKNTLVHLEPIDVARGLIAIFDQLPLWIRRTMRLSANAIRVRDIFKRARDPNQFLFDDIPAIAEADLRQATVDDLQRVIDGLHDGLQELVLAYPSMLHRLRDMMLADLEVPNLAPHSLAELRERAINVRQLAGDFHVEAFVSRLSHFDGSDSAFEGIASLAANKPPRDWVDPDLDRAAVDIADMAQKFLRAETFARVKGRTEKRHAIAVVIGIEGRPTPLFEEFHVGESDRNDVNAIISLINVALVGSEAKRKNVVLAALAELSARYMQDTSRTKPNKKRKALL